MSKSSQFFLNLFSLFLLFSCGCGKPKLHVNKVDKVDSVDVSDSEILKNKVSQAHKNLANVLENAIEGEATETQLKALESAIEDLVKAEEEKAILEVEAESEAEVEEVEVEKVVEKVEPANPSQSAKVVKKVTAVSRVTTAKRTISTKTRVLQGLIQNLKTTLERNAHGNQDVKKAYLKHYVGYIETAVDASVKAVKDVENDVKSVKQNQAKIKSAIDELKKAVDEFEKVVGEISNTFSNDNSFSASKTKLAELKGKLTISGS